MFLLFAVNNSI